MRKTVSLLALLAAVALGSGCANVERKMGRGIANTMEILRGGEFRRTMEQTALFDSPDDAYSLGFVRGVNRTLARTGLGVYEIVTAPIPPYDPIFTNYLAPGPVYPDNYKPALLADSMFDNDTYFGYTGGDITPLMPGSRFRIFDTR
jgi:putative exosortase-associated protein (TIGR04073 family)